jgi:hypothetical protein
MPMPPDKRFEKRVTPPAQFAAQLFNDAHNKYALSTLIQALDVAQTYKRRPHSLTLIQLSETLLVDRSEMGRILGKARREHAQRRIALQPGWERTIPTIIEEVFTDAQRFSILDQRTIQSYIDLYPTIVATPTEKRGKIKTRIKRELIDFIG